MREEPQAANYRATTPILALAPWLADPVEPAVFPQARLRFANRRWARAIGLDWLDEAGWETHFARFDPLPDNLTRPLALRYHGHQFRVYNPEIGDGRGFLHAQLHDFGNRLLDLGTKGSGQTPWSRQGDGRLTLKGAVREILATEILEALGVYTSKTFAVFETGEQLYRSDEPSPARSAVLTRLSHGHIRIGTFQRLLALDEPEHMAELVDYCLAQFPGPPPPANAPGREQPAVRLMHQIVERMADLAASWMASGFVHGVLNTDNMNISGESFDYGPWRFLPRWDPAFTAAYFDHAGLYAFGRQPEALHWNCAQMAVALRLLADAPSLIAAMERFPDLYMAAAGRRWCWRLGVESLEAQRDAELVASSETILSETGEPPDMFFFRYRGGRGAEGNLARALEGRRALKCAHNYWEDEKPQTLLIDEVEAIWAAISQDDDWYPLEQKIAALRKMGEAYGPPLPAAGHAEGNN